MRNQNVAQETAQAYPPPASGTPPVIASMIEWLDGQGPASIAFDGQTWQQVHAAGLVTDDEIVIAWLRRQAEGMPS